MQREIQAFLFAFYTIGFILVIKTKKKKKAIWHYKKKRFRLKENMKLTVEDLQAYLLDHYGGWATEQSMFMKLVEEIGEVAEVLNKRAGRKASDESDLQEQLGTELADMIHYIVAIAAINDIDLARIIVEKDKKAAIKYNHKTNLENFLENR